jgi:hypothetical protein
MTATEDLFTPIHKAIRSMIYDVGGRLQAADFADVAASAPVLADLEHDFSAAISAGCALCLIHHHGGDEEAKVFPSLTEFDPKLVARLIEEHHELTRRMGQITKIAKEIPKKGREQDRIAEGAVLNREVNDFFAEYLAHMNLEEVQLVPMMREHFTDQQMAAMRSAIMGGMPPERLAVILRWMLPSLSLDELTRMLGSLRATSPPPVVAFVGGIAAAHLAPERWQTVRDRVGW